MESAAGASLAGARSIASMKHVGLNVADRFFCVPANARRWRNTVEERMQKLAQYSENSHLNFAEYTSNSKVGVIAHGVCYKYAKEVFGDTVSYLKLGFTNPLPNNKIKDSRVCV